MKSKHIYLNALIETYKLQYCNCSLEISSKLSVNYSYVRLAFGVLKTKLTIVKYVYCFLYTEYTLF